MEWIEASIYTSSQGVEPVCDLLMDNGISGTQIQDDNEMKDFIESNPFNWDYVDEDLVKENSQQVYVKFYLPNTPSGTQSIEEISEALKSLYESGMELGPLKLVWEVVDDSEWSDNWKKYYKPFKIGQNIIIKPDWEDYTKNPGETVFTINPGNLFGTGLHQSTRLCIEQIEKHINQQSKIIDLGCGTGILSIIGLMLGAKSAFAVDMEPSVTEIVKENALKNSIDLDSIKIMCGNVLTNNRILKEIKKESFNAALVNIVADVIIELAPMIHEILDDNGIFITSGIILDRLDDVLLALKQNNFTVSEITKKDEWACVVSFKAE